MILARRSAGDARRGHIGHQDRRRGRGVHSDDSPYEDPVVRRQLEMQMVLVFGVPVGRQDDEEVFPGGVTGDLPELLCCGRLWRRVSIVPARQRTDAAMEVALDVEDRAVAPLERADVDRERGAMLLAVVLVCAATFRTRSVGR